MSAASTAELLRDAVALHRRGALGEAAARYAEVLRVEPANGDALYYLAMISCQREQFAEGAELARQSLTIDPTQARSHMLLGRALSALARPAEALASFERAIALAPDLAQAHGNRANILSDLGRFADAIESYDRALALMPDSVEDWFNRGLALAVARRREDAVASFDRALALKPDFAAAQFHRANMLVDLKRYDDALAACERVIAIEPRHIGALTMQGIALGMLGRHAASLASFDRAQAIKPDVVEVLVNRGCALSALERYDDALESFARVLAQVPDHVAALNHRGIAYFGLGQFADALASFDRVVQLDPDHADAHFNRGLAQTKLRLAAEARASFQRALALDPDHPRVLGELAKAYVFACDWAGFDQIRGAMMERVMSGRALVEPFLLFAIDSTPAEQLACAQTWLADIVGTGRESYKQRGPRAADKIRLAYVSADFREHATSYLLADIIESHDRTLFDVIAVSIGPDDRSEMRARMVKAFDAFHDFRNDSSETAAKFLYGQDAHIAIDLKGYTEFARPGVFAPRPAPVQVNFLGYPGTTGAAFMDYIVADPIVLPFEQQPFYSERIVHLPDSYQPSDSRRKMLPQVPSRREAGLAADGFVFCCFNNTYKITAPIFDVWMRLLGKVEGSVFGCTVAMIWLSPICARRRTREGSIPSGSYLHRGCRTPNIWLVMHWPICFSIRRRAMRIPRPAMRSGPDCPC